MNWQRMNIVIDRYERLATSQLRDLRKLQKMAINPNTDSASIRKQIDQIGQQLESSLAQLLSERGNLDLSEQQHFDERTEQIRKQIQTAIRATNALPPLTSKNPFLDDDSEDTNPYEVESKRYVQESNARVLEMKAKAEEARMTAEATAKLNKDMQDLEEIFAELATIVHEQHEVVDSIEEHVERATHDVQRGNEQLKKAIKHKTNQTTAAAAVVGGLAVGGPVGIAAGSAVAGIAAGIGGLVADVVNVEWEPMSLKQSKRLGAVLSGLSDYPKMNVDESKSFAILANAVKTKITTAIDDDLFVPIYSKQSIKNPATGCAAFLDRQYWAAIKLIRGLRSFSSFLSPATRFELVLDGVINRVCVVALETGLLDDITCERKVKALIAEIPDDMIEAAKPDSFRNLIRCLGRIVDEQKAAGRSYYRDVRKYLEKLQKKADENVKQS